MTATRTTRPTVSIRGLSLAADDPAAAEAFYAAAFGSSEALRGLVHVRAAEEPTSGFRGFTLSLVTSQPADVDAWVEAMLAAGATVLKPAARSLWGYGGVLQAPEGTIWKVATSTKRDTRPAARTFEEVVLLLGAADVAATRRAYEERGLVVARSFGRRYVEFAAGPDAAVKLALYGRKALAKDAGLAPEGAGSHGVVVHADAGVFTDPDGIRWETQPAWG